MNRRPVTTLVLTGLLAVPGFTASTVTASAAPTVRHATTRASVATRGTQGNGQSAGPAISANGRYIAFTSEGTNLVAGDTNDAQDVFVRDRITGATTRVSISTRGTQADGSSFGPAAISASGRYIAFSSSATNLVAGTTGGVFVRDRVAGTTTLVSVATSGAKAVGGEPAISADGRYVAFISEASNLVAGDTNERPDVFVRDRVRGTTTRASVATDGTQGSLNSLQPSISANGRYIAFGSIASNLVAGDTNGIVDVFVRDRVAGTTTRVNISTRGAQTAHTDPDTMLEDSELPTISADGRYVAFLSGAGNLVDCDTNGIVDVFVRDRVRGTTTRVSVATRGAQANQRSSEPAISANGRYVAFSSDASNLVRGDTNGSSDVFVRAQP